MTIYIFAVDYTDAKGTRWFANVAAASDVHAQSLLNEHHVKHQQPKPVSLNFTHIKPDSPVPGIGYALADVEPSVILVRKASR
jgi:hypothetical protein